MSKHCLARRARQSAAHPAAHPATRPSRGPRCSRLLALMLAGGLFLPAVPLQAQTWSGASVFSPFWSDAFNWAGLTVPASSASTAITFAGTRQTSPVQNLSSVFDLNALSFASGAGAFTLSGNALRFAGTAATFTQNSSNAVVLANAVQISQQLTYGGNGSATFKGGLANGAGGQPVLVKNGSGQLTLSEAGSFSGRVDLNQGRLRLEHGQALQSAQVVLNTGATLDLGGLASAQLRLLTGQGALALGRTVLTLGGSTVDSDLYGGNLSATTGGLVINAGSGAAKLSGVSSIDSVRVQRGGLVLQGGAMTLGNTEEGLTVGQGDGAGASARLDLNSGALVQATGRTVQVDGGADTQLVMTQQGTRLVTGFQTLVGNHATGALRVEGGATLQGGSYLAMGFNNGSRGSLQVGGAGTVSNTIGLLGVLAGATGQATVSGLGALWANGQLGLGGLDSNLNGGTGTLSVLDRGVVTVSDAITLWNNGSSLTVNGGQVRAGRLLSSGAVGQVVLTADGSLGEALQLNADGGSATFAGVISGAGSLRKLGGSVQTLSGLNTFSGDTVIAGGQIVLGHAGALFNSTAVLQVDDGLSLGGVSEATLGNLAGGGALNIGSATLRTGNNNRNARYTGVVQGAGGRLVKVGTGTATLAASGSSLALLAADQGVLALDGGSMQLVNAAASASVPVVSVAAGELQLLAGARVTANSAGASSVFVDSAAGGGRLLIDGSGSRLDGGFQVILGNVQQGSAVVRNGAALDAAFALALGVVDGSRGSLRAESGGTVGVHSMGLGVMPGSVGQAWFTGSGTRLAVTDLLSVGGFNSGQNGGTGELTLADGATARAAQTRLWTAGSRIEIDGGQLSTAQLTSQGAVGHVELTADPLGGSALVIDGGSGTATFAGSIGGAGSLRKTGAGTQVLSGSNSFSGAVQVAAGTLRMASGAASEYEVLSGAQLVLGARSLGAAVVQAQAGASVQYTGSTLSGGLLMGPGSHDIAAVRRLVGTTVSNGVQLTPSSGAAFVGVGNAGQVLNLEGRSFSWTGGANTSGTLSVRGSTAVSGFSSGGVIEVQGEGVLSNSGSDLVLSGGSRTRVGNVGAPGGTIQLEGDSRLQLNGGLLVNNGRIDGTVAVNYGGLAKGAGQYGTVIVGDGGRFSPGNSPGTVHTGSVQWGAGGIYEVELSAAGGLAGSDWDLWVVNGQLDITSQTSANGRFTVALSSLAAGGGAGPLAGFDPHRSWHWRVVDTTGGIMLNDPGQLALDTRGFLSDTSGGRFSLQVSSGDLYVNFAPAPVPEPGSWALMLGGLAVLTAAAARRSASTASLTPPTAPRTEA